MRPRPLLFAVVLSPATFAGCAALVGADFDVELDRSPAGSTGGQGGSGGAGGAEGQGGSGGAGGQGGAAGAGGQGGEGQGGSGGERQGGVGGEGGSGGAEAVCGNGEVETGEACDDGGTAPGDACTPDCKLACAGPGESIGLAFGSCYRLTSSPKTWEGARAECVAWGGDLVAIGSPDEQGFVTTLASPDASHWLGLNDIAAEGSFVWSSGEAAGYMNWWPGEPNDSGGVEDCAQIYPAANNFHWNDLNCAVELVGVCERPL